MDKKSPSRGKNALKNLSLLLVSLSFGFMLIEIFCRIFFHDTIVLFNRFHSTVSYGDITTRRLRPNTVFYHQSADGRWRFKINEKGFRQDWPSPYQKPANTMRILVLGDSHAQGMEVHQGETFASLLNGQACRGKTIETINSGISGSGTSEQLVFFQYEGKKYRPDIVIVAFFLNDFDNNLTAFHKLDEAGDLTLFRRVHPATKGIGILAMHNDIGPLSWLSQNSYAYSVALNSAWEFGKKVFYGPAKDDFVQKEDTRDAALERYKVELMNRIIVKLKDEADSISAELVVLDIPGFFGNGLVSSVKLNDLWSIERANIEVVSIAEMRSESYFVAHGHRHLNSAAHKRIAAELRARLCR